MDRSLYLAPMDGITDAVFRGCVERLYGGFDYYVTEFLRVPTDSAYKLDYISTFIGEITPKTVLQILASSKSSLDLFLPQIKELGVSRLDLNLGCPSSKVVSHKGGAYLLGDRQALTEMVSFIRNHFSGFFSVKMRVGVHDDQGLLDRLDLLADLGVDLVTLHARTKDDGYKNSANWNYLIKAKEHTYLPLVGNGDIWKTADIDRMFCETGVDGVMIGRGSFFRPWMASEWKKTTKGPFPTTLKEEILEYLNFLKALKAEYEKQSYKEQFILCRYKALSLYLPLPQDRRKELMRHKDLAEFEYRLEGLSDN